MAALLAASLVMAAAFPDLPPIVGASVEAAEIAVFPLAVLAAILDARLFDIDLVFRRSLVYGALIGLVVTFYAAAIAVTTAAAGRSATVVGTLVASVPVALALTPVKDWLTRQVETRLYGARRRPVEALALVGSHVDTPEPSTVGRATLDAAAQTLGSGLRLDGVRIVVDAEPSLVGEWSSGRPVRAAVRQPPVEIALTAFGASVGTVLVSIAPDDALTDNDLALLRQLAAQVGLIAHSVRTASALQRSRERIVGVREAERLRLRRDLHDGLGPALAGLTLQVEAVGACVATDPDRAVLLNSGVATGLRAVIDEVRAAVDGLRPAELDQLGLAGALAEQARSLSSGGLAVHVECVAPALPPATEVAAYRIASEAMANTLRHAQARSCLVHVVQDGAALVVRVEDDGRGVSEVVGRTGVGLDSMRLRAEEIGGRFTYSNATGAGTVVEAVLPLATAGLADDDLQTAPAVVT
jgi:signal transduction histidine kinase